MKTKFDSDPAGTAFEAARLKEMACLSQLTYLAHKKDTASVENILSTGSPGLLQSYQAIEFLKAPRLFGSPKDLVCCGLIASNENQTVIAIRGTENLEDYFYGLMVDPTEDKLHYGFSLYVDSFWEELAGFLKQQEHGKKDIFITGHSLGGAAATILTAKLQQPDYKPQPPYILETYIFGAPPAAAGELLLDTPVYRFRQQEDYIPHLRELTFGMLEGIPGLKMAIAALNPTLLTNLEKYSHIGSEYIITKDEKIKETTEPENIDFWQLLDLSRLMMTQFKGIGEEKSLKKLLKILIQNFFDDHRAIRYVERLNHGKLPPWWNNQE